MKLTSLGKLSRVVYRVPKRPDLGRMSFTLRKAPDLVYDRTGKLHVVYDARGCSGASRDDVKEYKRTHWGKEGDGHVCHGVVIPAVGASVVGALYEVTYTTEKGVDREKTDYVHVFGEGAKTEKWLPPILYMHRCVAPRCADLGRLRVAGGTYRVTARGIVG